MRLGVSAAFVDGDVVTGDVAIADGTIEAVGLQPPGSSGLASPGFIDIQVNGFAGIDYTTATVEDYRQTGLIMAATGVTAYQPTLITVTAEAALSALASVAEAAMKIPAPRIVGMHLEGPFLSPLRCGAHDPSNIVDPDLALVDRYLAGGPVTMMTIAPERPGAIEIIDHLVRNNIIVSLGHSDADAATTLAAFDAGATAVTHLFNAQRPFNHRDPGITGAALSHRSAFVSIIVDGHHLSPETVRIVDGAAYGRYVLITDAIAAAGRPDGPYPLGDRSVFVSNGEARLDDGTLAGSVLTMDSAVRNVVEIGIPLERALAAATSTAARAINRPDLGSISPGSTADVTILDDHLEVVRTLVDGSDILP